MRKYFLNSLLLVVLLLCVSCDWVVERKQARRAIAIAEEVMEQQPDSALTVLEGVRYPSDLDKSLRMNYWLLLVQARDKCYKDICSDTIIEQVKGYYVQMRNWEKASLAAFYNGRVYYCKKDYPQVMKEYLDAEKYAENVNDYNHIGLIQHNIGELHYQEYEYNEAIPRFKEANRQFSLARQYKNMVNALWMTGNSFLINRPDSALLYYKQAFNVAADNNDLQAESTSLRNMSVAYRRMKNFPAARKSLMEASVLNLDEESNARLYLAFANLYKDWNKNDSTIFYANKSLQIIDNKSNTGIKACAYFLLSEVEKERGRYDRALEYYCKYTTQISDKLKRVREKSILGIKERYDFEIIKNANQQLHIEQQESYLIVLILCLMIIAGAFWFYWKYANNRNRLLMAEQQIYQLKELADSSGEINEQSDTLRNLLLQRFDLLKKVSLLEGYLRKDDKERGAALLQKINDIVYDCDEGLYWDVFYKTINDLHGGFLDRLYTRFSQLNDSEFKVCCLTYTGFSNKEIAIFLKLSINTVQARKTAIRRKLKIGKRGDINEYITGELGSITS